jgi:hypothetical protein
MIRTERDHGPHAPLGLVDRLGGLDQRQCRVELDLGADQQLVGTKVQDAQMDQPADRRAVDERRPDGSHLGQARRLANEQAAHLDPKCHRDDAEQQPDRHTLDRVEAGLPRDHRQAHPHQRAAQPEQRPHILKQDNRELGALGTANERPPRQPGPHLVGLVDGGPQRPAPA